MSKHRTFGALVTMLLVAALASIAAADALVTTEVGYLVSVDGRGGQTVVAADLGTTCGVRRLSDGTIYVCSNRPARVWKVDEHGAAEVFSTRMPRKRTFNDLVVTADERVFVLAGGEVWEVFAGEETPPHRIIDANTATWLSQSAIGLDLGSDGDLYLATQGDDFGGRVLRATMTGDLVEAYVPPAPWPSFVDARFDRDGQLLVLAQTPDGPRRENREILRLHDGDMQPVVGPEVLVERAMEIAVDGSGAIYVTGGGYGGPTAMLQRIEPSGEAEVVATFPNDSLTDVDAW